MTFPKYQKQKKWKILIHSFYPAGGYWKEMIILELVVESKQLNLKIGQNPDNKPCMLKIYELMGIFFSKDKARYNLP